MKQKCRTRVSTSIGREVSVSEANFIEGRINRAATALAREDIKAWRAMTQQQQTLAATERAAGEIEAAARAVSGETLNQWGRAGHPQREAMLDLARTGDYTARELQAMFPGIPMGSLRRMLKDAGVKAAPDRHGGWNASPELKAVIEAAETGQFTAPQIAEMTGTTTSYVRNAATAHGIELPKTDTTATPNAARNERIRELIEDEGLTHDETVARLKDEYPGITRNVTLGVMKRLNDKKTPPSERESEADRAARIGVSVDALRRFSVQREQSFDQRMRPKDWPSIDQIQMALRKARSLRLAAKRDDIAPEVKAALENAAARYEAYARGEALFDQSPAAGVKRGDITFPAQGMGRGAPSMIRLYQARDMSTFLHESGHYFLELMATLAAEEGAAPGIVKLHEDARAWFDATWAAKSGAQQQAEIERWGSRRVWEHELFARTFEAYLMEGKAPSSRLRTIFAAFKDWLTRIYKSIRGIEASSGEVALTPEIKRVFDRMIASDEEIAAAQMEAGVAAMPQQALRLNDEQYAAYVARIEDARRQAEEALRAEIEAAFMAQKRADWKREQRRYRRTAELEINGLPTYRASEWIGRGRWLNGAAPGALANGMEANAERVDAEAAEAMRTAGGSAREAYRRHSEVPKAERDADWHLLDDELAAAAWAEVQAEAKAKGLDRPQSGYAHAPAVLDAIRLGDGGPVDLNELRRREVAARPPLTGDPARDALTRSGGGFDFARQGMQGPVQGGNTRPLTDTFEQFAGVTAATADLSALERAQMALDEGSDPETVRRNTGWFRGQDGKWRFEIDDSAAVVDMAALKALKEMAANVFDANETLARADDDAIEAGLVRGDVEFSARAKLDALVRHEALFAAYPFLRDVEVISWRGVDVQGAHAMAQPAAFDGSHSYRIWIKSGNTTQRYALEDLMHEVQHIIQFHELFEVGGDASNARVFFDFMSLEDQEAVAKAMRAAGKRPERDYDLYQYLSGEMEAFETQRRIRMSAERRLADTPETMRVPSIPTFRWTQEEWNEVEAALESKAMSRSVRGSYGETFGQFVGPRALTADLGNLSIASDLIAAGEDPDAVRKEWGWFKGPDGHWRYEIDDSQVVLNEGLLARASAAAKQLGSSSGMRIKKLHTLIQHEELFDAYPFLRDVEVFVRNNLTAYEAYTDLKDMSITLSSSVSAEHAVELLLHELQHLIQLEEGFAMGGNAQIAQALFSYLPVDEQQSLLKDIGMTPAAWRRRPGYVGQALYERISGEVEAFSAQDRRAMTAQERIDTTPELMIVKVLPSPPWSPQVMKDLAQRMLDIGVQLRSLRVRSSRRSALYSAAERAVATSKTARASGAQWWATISKTPGVKREELDWIGLEEWLKAQDGPVAREEVLAYVQANGVRVEETVIGGEGRSAEHQAEVLPLIEERDRIEDELNALPGYDKHPRFKELEDRHIELTMQIVDVNTRFERKEGPKRETRWSTYTLPGGENYRELLLRLPVKSRIAESDYRIETVEYDDGPRYFAVTPNSRSRAYETRDAAERALADRPRFEDQADIANQQYRSSHWDEPNVLAHIRFKERIDADGRRVLAIEEVQSDLHQAGRKKGYKDGSDPLPEGWRIYENEAQNWVVENSRGDTEAVGDTKADALRRAGVFDYRVPDAPFKDNKWAALSLKRMIVWAVENGFDAVSWIPGQVAVERFGVEKHIDSLELWRDPSDGSETLYTFKGDRNLQRIKITAAQPLESVIGKELAERLRNTKRDKKAERNSGGEYRILSGIDLKIGGEGMRAFYDRILVNIANDIGKKYGARVGETEVVTPTEYASTSAYRPEDFAVEQRGDQWAITMDRSRVPGSQMYWSRAEAEAGLKALLKSREKTQSLHSLPITDAMRTAVRDEGLTLFQRDQDPSIEPQPEDLLPMKLSPEGVADYVDEFGPEVAERLKPYLERGDKRDIDAVVAEIREAKRTKPTGKRLWVWVRDAGGIADGDIASQIERRKFPGLIRKEGRGLDDLARAAIEEGVFDMSKDADGYIGEMEFDEFRARLLADLAGDEQYPAQYAAENEAYYAAQRTLEGWEALGVDTKLTGAELREGVRAAVAAESARAVHPEDAAAAFGFPSGSALIRALLEMTPRAQAIDQATEAAMARDGLMDPFADGTLERQAKRLSHNEARASVLELEMEAIERATGGRKRALAGAAKEIAERQARAMTVRQIMNPDQFIAAERRFGLAAQRALEKGEMAEASRAKHRQLVAFYLYRASSRASEQVGRTLAKWKRLATNTNTRKAIAPAHLAQIDALLEELQMTPRTGVERESLEDWAATMEAVGLKDLVSFNPGVVEERAKQPVQAMAYEDFAGLAEAIANIEFIGRNVTKLQKMKSAQDFAELKSKLLDRAREQWPERIEKKVSRVAPRPIDRNLDSIREYLASQFKTDYFARLMDGLEDNGPWAQSLDYPAQAAQNDLTRREIAAAEQFRAILAKHGVDAKTLKRWMTVRLQIAEIGDARTMHQIISYAFNVGNAYNREALLAGEGWSAEQLQAVLSRMGKREWDLVRDVAAYVGQWKEESFALDERTRGVRPQEVQGEAFMTPFGMMEGFYWPVQFDPLLSDRAAQREAKAIAEGEMGGAYRRPATHRGRLKSRQGTGGQALMSDWIAVLDKHVKDTLIDITHRELVMDLARLKADPEVRQTIVAVVGRDGLKAFDAWVHRLSRKTEPRPFGESGLMKYLNRTYTMAAMGFKFSVSTLNLLGIFQAIPRNGVYPQLKQAGITLARDFPQMLISEAGRLLGGPGEMSARVRMVRAKSEMMANRMATFDRDMQDENTVAEVVRGVEKPTLTHFVRAGRYMTGLIDAVVSVPTWIASYEAAFAGKVKGIEAFDEKAAVDYADQVVRNTQGAGSRKDLSAMMATNNEWQRGLTLFMSWANTFGNQIMLEQVPGAISGKIPPHRVAVNIAFIWLLPALITLLFFGKLDQGDDEDDEEYARRIAVTIAAYPGQAFPFVRDAVSLAAEGRQPTSPYMALAQRAGGVGEAIEEEDNRALVKQGYLLAGSMFGAPYQGYVTGDYWGDVYMGDEDPNDLVDPEKAPDAWREMLVNDKR